MNAFTILYFTSLFFSYFASAELIKKALFNGKDLTGWTVDVPAHDKNSKLPMPFIIRDGNVGKPWKTIWAPFNG